MLETKYRPLADLVLLNDNPRQIVDADFKKLCASITAHPDYFEARPCILSDRTGELVIIAGNMRYRAATALALVEIPTVLMPGLTVEREREIVIRDNVSNGSWDWDALANGDWPDAATLNDWGVDVPPDWGVVELPAAEEGEPDLTPAKFPVTVSGDLYQLNDHAILCGDCRNFDDVGKLIDAIGKRAINVAVTSPPYAAQREYDESSGFKPIAPDDFVEWYADVASNIMAHLAPDGSYFCNIKEHVEDGHRSLYVKDLTLAHVRQWGWTFVDELCWERIGLPGKFRGRFKNGWEPIFHFALADGNKLKFDPYAVGHASDNVPVYSKETNLNPVGSLTGIAATREEARAKGKNRVTKEGLALPSNRLPPFQTEGTEHSAAFPIDLPAFFIKAFSGIGDVAYDPFMGSGTTLMAAEKAGRVGIGTELSPNYTDLIVRRWLRYMADNNRPATVKRNGTVLTPAELAEFTPN